MLVDRMHAAERESVIYMAIITISYHHECISLTPSECSPHALAVIYYMEIFDLGVNGFL